MTRFEQDRETDRKNGITTCTGCGSWWKRIMTAGALFLL